MEVNCHWCNYYRAYNNFAFFNNCKKCQKIYCKKCTQQYPFLKLKQDGCLFCLKNCKCINLNSKLYCFDAKRAQNNLLKEQNSCKLSSNNADNLTQNSSNKRPIEWDINSMYTITSNYDVIKVPYKKRKIMVNVGIVTF